MDTAVYQRALVSKAVYDSPSDTISACIQAKDSFFLVNFHIVYLMCVITCFSEIIHKVDLLNNAKFTNFFLDIPNYKTKFVAR